MHCRYIALQVVASCVLAGVAVAAEIPAFPGAEGFGSTTPGGRGGKVLAVTTLADYGPKEKPIPGSFRAACLASGPRIVVFRIAGTIELKAPLRISEPFLTIAGQTAPGGGICLRNYTLDIRAHDVVVRYLRVRPGDTIGESLKAQGKEFSPDGLSIGARVVKGEAPVGSRNVVIDHCSASWAIDECLSVSGENITDVTVQWCLITEALNDSYHHKGEHGYGSLLRTNGNVTFHHNLYAHNQTRSPRPGTYGPGSILLDFRNNVIYDTNGYSAEDPVRMNYVGNYVRKPRKNYAFLVGGEATKLYAAGNFLFEGGARNDDPWALIRDASAANRISEPFPVAPVTTETAEEAYARIVKAGGASLPARDAVDLRIIEQLTTGTGDLIDSQREVGGWPQLEPAAAPPDSDGDGMPDAWEAKFGLDFANPNNASDDPDGDGYSNVEEYLNSSDPGVRD